MIKAKFTFYLHNYFSQINLLFYLKWINFFLNIMVTIFPYFGLQKLGKNKIINYKTLLQGKIGGIINF